MAPPQPRPGSADSSITPEEMLRQATDDWARLIVAGLAHQGRNALQRSQSCLTLLELRAHDRPEMVELLGRIQQAQDELRRLYDVVQEFLAPVWLKLCDCQLAPVWRAAWSAVIRRHDQTRAELREEADEPKLWCLASPPHLKQVFGHLFENALAAGTDAAPVEIHASAAELAGEQAVRIAVRDHGPGLTAEQRQRAFEPFFTTKTRAIGLGLAICQRIVEAHGGRIAVGRDLAPGTEILITLPRWRKA